MPSEHITMKTLDDLAAKASNAMADACHPCELVTHAEWQAGTVYPLDGWPWYVVEVYWTDDAKENARITDKAIRALADKAQELCISVFANMTPREEVTGRQQAHATSRGAAVRVTAHRHCDYRLRISFEFTGKPNA